MIRPPLLPPFMADANAPPVPAEPMAAPSAPPEPLFDEPMSAPAGGPLPPAPQAEPEQSKLSRLLELFALGAAIGAGPQGGGTGILQGVSQAREQQKAEREARAVTAARQQQAMQAAAIQEQRRQAEQQKQRLDYIKEAQKAASAARTPDEHDQIVTLYERASGQILGAALRPGVLRRLVPYNGPTAKSDAEKVLDQIQKGKYAEEILSNPDTAIEGTIGGQRVRRSLREWQELAGAATVIGPQGKPQVIPKGAADTQATYERLKEVFTADHKREPDAKEDYALWLKAKKDIGQADDRPPINIKVGADKPLTRYQRYQIENDLRTEANKVVAPVREITRQVGVMRTGLDDARRTGRRTVAVQAVISPFNRILEPGSVTRESEYARTSEGQGLIEALRGKVEAIQAGGQGVTIETLEDAVRIAEQIAADMASYADNQIGRLRMSADEYQVPAERVLPRPEEYRLKPRGGAASRPPAVSKLLERTVKPKASH